MPIESAPKDGTAVLGYWPQRRGFSADQTTTRTVWTDWGGGMWEGQFGKGVDFDGPTHWMPLPPPPHPKGERE
jgi:hypothetical protein